MSRSPRRGLRRGASRRDPGFQPPSEMAASTPTTACTGARLRTETIQSRSTEEEAGPGPVGGWGPAPAPQSFAVYYGIAGCGQCGLLLPVAPRHCLSPGPGAAAKTRIHPFFPPICLPYSAHPQPKGGGRNGKIPSAEIPKRKESTIRVAAKPTPRQKRRGRSRADRPTPRRSY